MFKKRIKKILKFALKYKFWTILILVLISVSSYFIVEKLTLQDINVTYTTKTAEKGTLIQTVSGSGQVSSLSELNLKTQASGEVTYIGTQNGQEISAGQLILQIDSSDAKKTVRDAKANLESAQLSLEKLLQPANTLSILQAENNLINAKQDKINAENDLENEYENVYSAIIDAFLDLPTIITGLNDALYGYDIAESTIMLSDYSMNKSTLISTVSSSYQDTIKDLVKNAENNYDTARDLYNDNFDKYEITNRSSEKEIIKNLLDETIETIKAISEAIKSDVNLFNYWVDYRSQRNQAVFSKITSWQSSLETYTSTINNHLSILFSNQRSIENQEETIIQAERDIAEKIEILTNLEAGADELDIKSQELTIRQRENTLHDAQENLTDYYMYSPFNGTIAGMDIQRGEVISNNASIATLITDQKVAKITLNEIDITNIKIGQKATIIFDAVEDLSTSGEVIEIDPIGTISQNVVGYDIKIAFDTQDNRIKSGMSMSASIIIGVTQNGIIIPSSAIKENDTGLYVEVLKNNQPVPTTIEIGLSNNTMTEITSGLNVGDQIITQTKNNNSNLPANNMSSKADASRGMMKMMKQ